MKKLLDLSEWKEKTMDRGKGVGNVVKERKCLGIDKFNYCIYTEQEHRLGAILTPSYFQTMRSIFSVLPWGFKLNTDEIATKIIDELMARTGIVPESMPECKDMQELGAHIDRIFGTSHIQPWDPGRVYKMLTKEEPNATDEGI